MIPSPERLQETQLGSLRVPSGGFIYWYNTANVRKCDDSYDRVVHTDKVTETRHHDSYYIIHCIIVHHHESYLDTTDIITSRPPVWPYSYISVDHAASRRYGRCQALCCTGLPPLARIMHVSNGLTEGEGLRYIDGNLSLL